MKLRLECLSGFTDLNKYSYPVKRQKEKILENVKTSCLLFSAFLLRSIISRRLRCIVHAGNNCPKQDKEQFVLGDQESYRLSSIY